jgi:hypothetical protein
MPSDADTTCAAFNAVVQPPADLAVAATCEVATGTGTCSAWVHSTPAHLQESCVCTVSCQ